MKDLVLLYRKQLLGYVEMKQIRGGYGDGAPSTCTVNCSSANGGGSETLTCNTSECNVDGECVKCSDGSNEICCNIM